MMPFEEIMLPNILCRYTFRGYLQFPTTTYMFKVESKAQKSDFILKDPYA